MRKHGGRSSRERPESRRQRRGPGPGLGERPLRRANVTSPHPHRLPPESARSAGDPRAGPGHRPRPAASTRRRPGSGAARRHHAGHPEDPPAADLQDRHRPRGDGTSGGERGGPGGCAEAPAACAADPALGESAGGFVAGSLGSGGRTPEAWWQMAWSTRPAGLGRGARGGGAEGEGRPGSPGGGARAAAAGAQVGEGGGDVELVRRGGLGVGNPS